MFTAIGQFCVRRRWVVVGSWVLALLVLGGVIGAVGTDVRSEFDLPDVESRAGFDILEDNFGGMGAGSTGTIVFQSGSGFEDPAATEAIGEFLDEVDALPDTTVSSPFAAPTQDPEAALRAMSEFFGDSLDPTLLAGPQNISEDGTVAYAEVELPGEADQERSAEFAEAVQSLEPDLDGVRIEYGGMIFSEFEAPSSELLGLAFAIVILILAGGSVLAMGMPIGVALAGIGVGSSLLMLLSNVMSTPDFAPTLGVMIGLGVGIDYALFIVTRYREQLHNGHTVEESVVIAIDTSGRAVTFAGMTVVISLLGMIIMGVGFVNGLALGSAIVVSMTLLASLTLLPALLGFVGPRIEVSRWRGVVSAALVGVGLVALGLALNPLVIGIPLALALLVLLGGAFIPGFKERIPARKVKPLRETGAYRWSRMVQARPWTIAIASAVVLLVAAIPLASMNLGFSDNGNDPEASTTRQAYDLLAEGFGPGSNGPLTLVTELEGVDPAALVALTEQIADTPGVASVTGPIPNTVVNPEADEATAALWQVQPTTSPQDSATTDLVKTLRSEVLPSAEPAGTDVHVTGFVAVTVDFSDYLSERLAWFFVAVLSLSFLLLMVVFRSILVPLKAVIMNLLSIGAAYGLLVAFFQWGWGGSVLGIEPAPIEPFLPMMLFAIVFGLSMDYEVFLLSRIHEEWQRTGDARESVADGLAATAKVITAAAAIMVFIFGSFVLEDARPVKVMGFGLAVAVLLDATVVRMLLVPATMELLGERNWWLPRWLDRIIPHVSVEGATHDEGDTHDEDGSPAGDGGSPDDAGFGAEREPEPV
ncbi:MAG: MMPL family transporter [Microthrixaceae bacterium]